MRDLQLSRGDIRLYLTDGMLSFVTPVVGQTVAAVFTTAGSDTGDAEVLVLPPQRSERASLASFTNSPNLDEHVTSALLLFSDGTATELLAQIEKGRVRKAPELAAELAPKVNPAVEDVLSRIDVRMVGSLLDNHEPAAGFFYALCIGRTLGNFDVLYEPTEFEPVSVGRLGTAADGKPNFELWTSFRPRRAPRFVPPPVAIAAYAIDTTIRPDLSMTATARFEFRSVPADGRVLSFVMSEKLKVLSGAIDGVPAAVFQRVSPLVSEVKSPGTFLLVAAAPVAPGKAHRIEIRYEGSVIRQTGKGVYFVDDRNTWYPTSGTMLAHFDLTFRCPEHLRVVSTGEPVSEDVAAGTRVVHRKTQVPEHLAGFNLGEFEIAEDPHARYRVECFSESAAPLEDPRQILSRTESILDDYTRRWMPLPIHSVAVSPVPGYFGQGFPGLIYLSNLSYLRQEDRPAQLRNPRLDTFFSEMLLPHEIAHQWWGNLVSAADYRASWLMEAMADYSALQFVEREKGAAGLDAVLQQYREDLLHQEKGKPIEAAGPVDFGPRLLDNNGFLAWHLIVYEKGAWVLHMLRERLGEAAFMRMQVRLLQQFSSQPLTNEDFRKLLGEFVPGDQPDPNLSVFFDAWVYGTGIPKLTLARSDLELSGVEDDFSVDVPLHCRASAGKERVQWVRATSGSNPLDLSPNTVCALPPQNEFLYVP
ncbi:MAG TPA: M1 family aminopeptidase [Bryobacteraceae bacterium]|nr:M1 family aminopeptidase [Bryobacteraceae bacterium]